MPNSSLPQQFNNMPISNQFTANHKSNFGHWEEEEKLKYLYFLEFHMEIFCSKKKRNYKLFSCLSKFIQSRTPDQCRCHHRKLLQRFSHCRRIIDFLKKNIDEPLYKIGFKKAVDQYLSHHPIQTFRKINFEEQMSINRRNQIEAIVTPQQISIKEQQVIPNRQIQPSNTALQQQFSNQIQFDQTAYLQYLINQSYHFNMVKYYWHYQY